MFDRFVRLAQARSALRDGHFDRALRLVDDPEVRGHRKAAALRRKALEGLLDRARRRGTAGCLSSALADCERALCAEPEHGPALVLRADLKRTMQEGAGRAESARAICRDARSALERGDLATASALREAASRMSDGADVAELGERISTQGAHAKAALGDARAARERGDFEAATVALAGARAQDDALGGAGVEARALAKASAAEVCSRLERALTEEGPGATRAIWATEVAALPELEDVRELERVLRRIDQLDRKRIFERLDHGDVRGAVEVARGAGARKGDALASLVEQLSRASDLAERGELAEAASVAEEIADELGIGGLERVATQWSQQAAEVDRLLRDGRAEATEGRLVDARATILEVLRLHPGHVLARREIDLLEQGAEDRERRMGEARELARCGDLRAAAARLVALTVPGPQGDEARVLLRDLQQRMDTVQAGVRQVLRAMHGRDSASREGLLHCVRRLDQLGSVQKDAEDLVRLKEAAMVEAEGLQRIDEAAAALARDDAATLGQLLGTLAEDRDRLLTADRLDARVLEIVDDGLTAAARRIDGGWTRSASVLLDAMAAWSELRADVEDRAAELRSKIEARRERAGELAERARHALDQRDVVGAEELLEQAREAATDEPAVARVAQDILDVRRREERLDGVESLADGRDFEGAQRELGRLGPTPSLLRTRIYDLKKSLARAQGLDGAFLLRVDEGGEFLVIRGESVTLGNLRDGSSDLPMLARLAGRHARLKRTLSFHGGQEDRIVAERGEVWSDGRRVDSLRLTDRTRFRLGEVVEIDYRLPSERSLTSVLRIGGGFRVAGTDKILWMKDRGRDGRILVGSSADAHVPVDTATGEVEIFAGRDGQVRVRCAGGGEIDGQPFGDEHPATAGVVIQAAGVSFVLLPWDRH